MKNNVTYKKNRFTVLFRKIWITIVIFFFLKPEIAEDIPALDVVFNASRFGLAIVYLFLIFLYHRGISRQWIIMTMIFLIALCSTIFVGKNYTKVLAHFVPSIGFIAFIIYQKKYIQNILEIFCDIGLILLIANLVSVIIFPNGLLYRSENSLKIWILGQKQDLGGFLLPFLFSCSVLRYVNKKKYNKKFYLTLLLEAVTVFFERSVGLILCLMFFFILCISDIYIIKMKKKALLTMIVVAAVLIIYICASFDNLTYLQAFLDNIGKDGITKLRTVNVRFEMWRFAWNCIQKHPFFGVGKLTIENWYEMTNVGYHSILDNMYFDIALTGGIVSLVLFLKLLFNTFKSLTRCWFFRDGRFIGYSVFALCILLFEGSPYFPSVFFVFSLPIWFQNVEKIKKVV